MKKLLQYSIGTFWLILLLAPLLAYLINFSDFIISKDTEVWGQFGDYLNGTFMPMIALSGLIITAILGVISERRNQANLKLEQLKNRPFIAISTLDGRSKITLTIMNKGNGPLFVEKFYIQDISKNITHNSIYSVLPKIHNRYDYYAGGRNGMVLSPNERELLFKFELTEKKDKETFYKDIEIIRSSFKSLEIHIEYTDLYGNNMPPYYRNLKWFSRPPESSLNEIKKDT